MDEPGDEEEGESTPSILGEEAIRFGAIGEEGNIVNLAEGEEEEGEGGDAMGGGGAELEPKNLEDLKHLANLLAKSLEEEVVVAVPLASEDTGEYCH